MSHFVRRLALPLLLAPTAAAGDLLPVFVCDAANGSVRLCRDLDGSGAFDAQNEIATFYDGTAGALALPNPAGLVRDPRTGALFVSDPTTEHVLRLVDLDGNGDALGPGEATLFFDGAPGSGSGIELGAPRGMWLGADGNLYLASAGGQTTGADIVLRLRDLDHDGEAEDAVIWLDLTALTGSTLHSPTAISAGADGALYLVDTGTAPGYPRGVYRLEDLDGNDRIDRPNEYTAWFVPPTVSGGPFYTDLTLDVAGRMYTSDLSNRFVWGFADTDGDGVVDPNTEATLAFTFPAASLAWDLAASVDGSLYVVDDQAPERILRFVDLDGDGYFSGATEVETAYAALGGVARIESPRALAGVTARPLASWDECTPAAPNSTGAPGRLEVRGSSSILLNDLVLEARDLPANGFGVVLAATGADALVLPATLGTLCLGGAIGRYAEPGEIGFTGAAGGFDHGLESGALRTPLGNVAARVGATWRFQVWYRDAAGGAAANLTNAVAVRFAP